MTSPLPSVVAVLRCAAWRSRISALPLATPATTVAADRDTDARDDRDPGQPGSGADRAAERNSERVTATVHLPFRISTILGAVTNPKRERGPSRVPRSHFGLVSRPGRCNHTVRHQRPPMSRPDA